LSVYQEHGGVAAKPEPQDKVQSLRDQVDGVKNIMTQNVDRILARGERLDDLMDKSEDLQAG
ncbi:Vesicle-associated membrane protein 8, partial [Nibea albiflora]